MNSIKQSLQNQPQSFGAELRQLMPARIKDGKWLIVVEGKDDKTIYSRFYNEHKYKVWNSTQFPGCGDFEKTASRLNETYRERFILIKDADFDHLDHKTYPDTPNLFLTDTHDIETQMLTDEFFTQLNSQPWEIHDAQSLCQEVMQQIIHLSYIKWMSRTEDRKLKFSANCCSVGQQYDGTRQPDITHWLDQLRSSKQPLDTQLPTQKEVEHFENIHPEAANQLTQLTNGHDLLTAMNIKIKTLYHGKILKTQLPDLLKKSYTKECYMKSKLYRAIAQWEQTLQTRKQQP